MSCFGFVYSTSTAANCDGSCVARTSTSFALIAGIAAAVSALFVFALLGLRLPLIMLLGIIVSIIILSVLLVRTFSERRKR